MTSGNVFIAGLPSAGKTTLLAALWHLVQSKEVATELTYAGLEGIDVKYLNAISEQWLQHKDIGRTKAAQEQLARINLQSPSGDRLTLSLPDFAGEGFKRMWESRWAPSQIAASAQAATGHLILINADMIVYPMTADELRDQIGGECKTNTHELPFALGPCPTAAKIADVLVSLEESPILARPNRAAIGLTAWDAVANEGLTPKELFADRLPLLQQMMDARGAELDYRVYGISAQGGSYEDFDPDKEPARASERIRLVEDDAEGHDLTRMLSWLVG